MSWYVKSTGGYAYNSAEATNNAFNLAYAMYSIGWCKESVAAMLGNGAGESGLNPWRWESDYIPTVSEFQNWTPAQAQQHGYGIFQFTPANKYINATNAAAYPQFYAPNFSDQPGNATDGESQTLFFSAYVYSDWRPVDLYGYYADNFSAIGVDISPWYYTNYSAFKAGTDNNANPLTLHELVGVFELNYERPGDTYAASSYNSRCNMADYWYGVIPDPPGLIPVWLLFKFNKRWW